VGDKFSVDREAMLRASARFSLESEELASALSRLQASLRPLSGMCGNDEQGQKFGAGYNPNATNLEQALQNLANGLSAIGRGLEVMEINYQGSDAASQVHKGG
jgi:uncharacterized protein YukE